MVEPNPTLSQFSARIRGRDRTRASPNPNLGNLRVLYRDFRQFYTFSKVRSFLVNN